MITKYILKSLQPTCAQWGDGGDVIDISNWLTQKYGPNKPGLIADAALEDPVMTGPAWEIDEENNRLFIKGAEAQFWVNPTDWIVMTFYADGNIDVVSLTDSTFQYNYDLA